MKNLYEMKEELIKVWDTYHTQGTIPWTHETATQDLSYQIGSLNKLDLQLKNFRYREGMTEEEIKAKIADELADILAETIFIADGYGIDLYEAWEAMLGSDVKKISERAPDEN